MKISAMTISSHCHLGTTIRSSTSLLQLDFDEVKRRCARVLHGARHARLLPEVLACARFHPAVGLTGHGFHELAAIDDNAYAGCALFEGRHRLARLQHQPPGAIPRVIVELLVTGRTRRGREAMRRA